MLPATLALDQSNKELFPIFIEHMAHHRYAEAEQTVNQMTGQYKSFSTIYLKARHNIAEARDALLPLVVRGELVAWKYLNLGTWSMMLGSLSEAESYFARSIEASTDDDFIAWAYVNWAGGIAERNQENDPKEAARAMEIVESGLTYSGASDDARNTLQAILGLCYKALDRYDDALTVFRQLHNVFPDPLSRAMVEGDIADLYRLKGELDRAVVFAQSAWDTIREIDVAAHDKLGILLSLIRAERHCGNFEEAMRLSEFAIGKAEESRATIIRERDRVTYFGLLRDCYQQAIRCCLSLGYTARAFNYSEMSRARTLADMNNVEPITWEEIEMPSDMAIISYYVVERSLIAFVLKGTDIHVRDIGLVDTIDETFDSTGYPRNLMPGANGKLRKVFVLDRIADQIARPLDPLVEDCERLCLIPFGPLHHIPMAAVFGNSQVFRSPSATLLLHQGRAVRRGSKVVAVGYNDNTLRHAEAEAIAVGDIVHVGEGATRAALMADAGSARWLHISAHGYFDAQEPECSYIQLADGPLYAADIAENLRLDAELVVLSSCDSGRSQIRPGDEPFGLVRSFMTAGAPSVVCTLWPVDEVATRLLMERFYQLLRNGMRTANALRAAQGDVRALRCDELVPNLDLPGIPKGASQQIVARSDDDLPFAHPYWWAGFVLVGDKLTR